jgi:L-alanine-DL-glutamate epimerase-like enolase superfamily enzyme
MRDGWFDIPSGPGLGVDVDETFVRSTASVQEVIRQPKPR